MMQAQFLATLEDIVPLPAAAGAIGAGNHQSVQDRYENGAFDVELEFLLKNIFSGALDHFNVVS